jgi:uncharacterized LabA/DUF88 family protein
MAVHGTRRGESVSWDYEGLLQLLSSLARERSGLPLLRCYWYEATVDGRRTTEQDALADLPGIKLRVAKIRPGRREGVETEIHRDLTTLARNNAISDALVISAEEDLAQVIADVQDLGLRVTLVHIAVDGNWTISRALRQESDDIIEIGGEHLRPYVELIAGAEPVHADEQEGADHAAARPLSNGHAAAAAASYQQLPASANQANHAPPSIYTAPVVAEYQRPALQLPRVAAREDRAREDRTAQPAVNGEAQPQSRPDIPARPDIYATPASPARGRQDRPDRQEPAPPNPAARSRGPEEAPGYPQGPQGPQGTQEAVPGTTAASAGTGLPSVSGLPGATGLSGTTGLPGTTGPSGTTGPEPIQAPPGQLRRLPSARTPVNQPPMGPMGSMGGQGSAPMSSGQHGVPGQGSARSAPYSGPQPVATSGYQPAQSGPSGLSGPSAGGVSLADAVQAAHEEGQEFGGSVARDAPALWLEAVLARKPRMPSDLEARLLQGSALPIDFLLHDEVRHALRRGFWDALERTRR